MTTATVVRHATWYHNATPTVIDALALVRRPLWGHMRVCTSPGSDDLVAVPRGLVERITASLGSAA